MKAAIHHEALEDLKVKAVVVLSLFNRLSVIDQSVILT